MVNKQRVIAAIVARLTQELELYTRAAQTARLEATDEECKAEGKYDTRGLEASYLARGQSRQAAETEAALAQYVGIAAGEPGPSSSVELGALLELEVRKARTLYYVGPSVGGTEVTVDGEEVTVLTLASPLGQQLSGRKAGERMRLPSGESGRIVAVT